jgi:O-antigen/teichoic acid export membrane protein
VLRALGLSLLFLQQSVLSRRIGPADYGIFSYALASAGVLAAIVPLGWPTALVRFIAQYTEREQWGLLRGAWLRANQIALLSSTVTALGIWGVTSWWLPSSALSRGLRFAAVLLPLLAFVGLRRRTFQGLQQIKVSILLEEIILPLFVVTGVLVFAVTTASNALTVYAGAALAVALCGSVWLWYSLPTHWRDARPEYQTRQWMTVALPMVFGGISQIILNRTDVLILGDMIILV